MGSVANVADIQIIYDGDTTVKIKATAFYAGGTSNTANQIFLQANTVRGANASISPCMLDVENIIFNSGTANGQIRLEWVSSVNTNTAIFNFGHSAFGELDDFVVNNANTPTGDIGLFTSALQGNDAWSLIITFRKRIDGSGAFANVYAGYNPANNNSYGR